MLKHLFEKLNYNRTISPPSLSSFQVVIYSVIYIFVFIFKAKVLLFFCSFCIRKSYLHKILNEFIFCAFWYSEHENENEEENSILNLIQNKYD